MSHFYFVLAPVKIESYYYICALEIPAIIMDLPFPSKLEKASIIHSLQVKNSQTTSLLSFLKLTSVNKMHPAIQTKALSSRSTSSQRA